MTNVHNDVYRDLRSEIAGLEPWTSDNVFSNRTVQNSALIYLVGVVLVHDEAEGNFHFTNIKMYKKSQYFEII